MIWFRYSEWSGEEMVSGVRLQDLLDLFHQLLIRVNGNVPEALQWLTELDEQHDIFDKIEGIDFDQFVEWLKDEGLIRENNQVLHLTEKGGRNLRQSALEEIFSSLKKSGPGRHPTPHTGAGQSRLNETRPYQFGDPPTNIDFSSSLQNAIRRTGLNDLRLHEDDLEVYQTEHMTSCATVLLLDISHSMVLYGEDRITPAKKVALALAEFIHTQYPGDSLDVVVFGDDAAEIPVEQLPFISVGPYHTNTRAGLDVAQKILRRKRDSNKQVFMITDGKPSAMYHRGRLYRNSFGLDRRIVNRTLDEAVKCRRSRIVITTFMVAQDPYLVNFVEELTKANRGRAYYASLNRLSEYVFVDYIRNRRRSV